MIVYYTEERRVSCDTRRIATDVDVYFLVLVLPGVGDFADQIGARFERLFPLFPAGRADFVATGLAHFGKSANLANHLGDIASHRRRENFGSLHDTVGVNQEPAPDIDIFILVKDLEQLSHFTARIGQHRERHSVRHQLLQLMLLPALVDKLAVDRADEHLGVEVVEFLDLSGDRR